MTLNNIKNPVKCAKKQPESSVSYNKQLMEAFWFESRPMNNRFRGKAVNG